MSLNEPPAPEPAFRLTTAETVRRAEFALQQALQASKRGEDARSRSILVTLFYDLDEWLRAIVVDDTSGRRE